MNEQSEETQFAELDLVELSAEIVCSYVTHNSLNPTEVPKLLQEIHTTLKTLQGGTMAEPMEKRKPAVSVRKSVTPDYIICLEDGKRFKSLKRHLKSHFNLSPEEYRLKWGLPSDYPMVAKNYSEKRSRLARENGLGRKAG